MAHAAMPPEEVFVKVCGAAGSEEVIELPADADGAMDYATLCSQFPGAVGLQYHNEQTKTTRALRVVDGRKIVPPAAGGWGARTYVVVVADVATDTAKAQQKRKAPSPDAEPSGQKPRLASESTAPVPQPGPTLPTTAQYELPGKSEPCTRLFLGNLPFSATVEQLKTMFPSALDITLPRHSDSGNIKGFGNATFATVEIAHKVICEKDGFELDGRNVRLDFAPLNASRRRGSASGWGIGGAGGQQMRDNFGKPLSEACNRLHVANLPFTVTEEIMKGLFPDATAIDIPRWPDSGKVKGFAYVKFEQIPAAMAAVAAKQGADVDGRQIKLDFAPYGLKRGSFSKVPKGAVRGGFSGGGGGGGGMGLDGSPGYGVPQHAGYGYYGGGHYAFGAHAAAGVQMHRGNSAAARAVQIYQQQQQQQQQHQFQQIQQRAYWQQGQPRPGV